MFLHHWKETLKNNTQFNTMLLSIKKLLVFNADCFQYRLIQPFLVSLLFHNNALQHLHLVFKTPSKEYSSILSQLIVCRISVHTMILEVEKGHGFYGHDLLEDSQKMKSLCWPNTVRLTLSVQCSDELFFLLQRDALPKIEHLSITNEDIRTTSSLHRNKLIPNIQLGKKILHETVDGARLRSLLLRYIILGDLILLMDSLNMPVLDRLVLVDLYDHTLDHVEKFQELCSSARLPALKNLHFSFCFPRQLEHAWRISSFNCNNEWPFHDIDCYIDENWSNINKMATTLFIVYKRPASVLLQYKRALHNHHFASHVSIPIITRRRSIEWTCDRIEGSDQLFKTIQVIASNRVDKLYLKFPIEQVHTSITSNYLSNNNIFLHHLRSLTFDFNSKSMEIAQRVSIVKQILDISPNLSRLVIGWNYFRHCSQTYSNLKHLHLILDQILPHPKEYVNVDRLTQLAPNLCIFETSRATMMYNDYLVEFVLKIIRRFDQLVYLTLNKDNRYPPKKEQKKAFEEKLLSNGHNQLFDQNNLQIMIGANDRLHIWL